MNSNSDGLYLVSDVLPTTAQLWSNRWQLEDLVERGYRCCFENNGNRFYSAIVTDPKGKVARFTGGSRQQALRAAWRKLVG